MHHQSIFQYVALFYWPEGEEDNEAFSCPGIFSRTLCFYYVTVASSPGSPRSHLLDGHRKFVGSSAIPARSCPGPVRYPWGSVAESLLDHVVSPPRSCLECIFSNYNDRCEPFCTSPGLVLKEGNNLERSLYCACWGCYPRLSRRRINPIEKVSVMQR